MPINRKRKTEVAGMWINPNSTLGKGHIAWDRRKTDAVNARFLDLAEVALRTTFIEPQKPGDSLHLLTTSAMAIRSLS